MALSAPGSPHSFPSTSRDAVGYSPSLPSSTSTERFLHITGEVVRSVLLADQPSSHHLEDQSSASWYARTFSWLNDQS